MPPRPTRGAAPARTCPHALPHRAIAGVKSASPPASTVTCASALLGRIGDEGCGAGVQQLAGHTFFTCDPEQEEEATWLAACLLLPRPLLLREAYNGTDANRLAAKYQVSDHMARFRLNTSGVLLQARRARAVRTT